MPFIVQCPHADCRKFMLLEDEVRGTTVSCLMCSKSIRVDASGSKGGAAPPPQAPPQQQAQTPPPKAAAPTPKAAPPEDKVVVTCPNPSCKMPLRVPTTSKGTSLRCPKCKQVFKA